MENIFDVINGWHVVVQGALGSGLFWIFLKLMGYFYSSASNKFLAHSDNKRKSWILTESIKYKIHLTKDNTESSMYFLALTYKAVARIIRAFMWLSMGLIFQSFFAPLGVVGFIGCLHYLFRAYECVSPTKEGCDPEAELEKLESEKKQLENKT